MNNNNFLYGASVQGIQSFIFKTNKLIEVIGASEMVEYICTKAYEDIIKVQQEDIIITAAGNIKLLLSEDNCKEMVRKFPKKIMEYAPGITIVQAVVKLENENANLSDAINSLEDKLQAQRNKPSHPFEMGFMATERDRHTNGVAVKFDGKRAICRATNQKREISEDNFKLLHKLDIDTTQATKQIEDLSIGNNSFVAVVHADGNGLGNLLRNIGAKLKSQQSNNELIKTAFKNFSKQLNTATEEAAAEAFKIIKDKTNRDPIRPILLGGDDLTVIIQADLALPFVESFLKKFEEKTQNLPHDVDINPKGLTACAGIAYVKDKFPLHYAMNLAEQLCSEAKQHTQRKTSGISFYKVQESYVGTLSDMRKNIKIGENIKYSPYNMDELQELKTVINALKSSKDENIKGASKLRNWLTELTKDQNAAKFMLSRIKTVNNTFFKSLKTDNEQIIYDALQIQSLRVKN